MKRLCVGVVIALMTLAGCATKYYGRENELTTYERNNLSCPEIDIETAKVDAFQQQVAKESQSDRRSVLFSTTDFSIGNAMSRDAAIKSANRRRHQLDDLRVEKGCGERPPAPAAAPIDPVPSTR